MEAKKYEIISEDQRKDLEHQLFLMDLNEYMAYRYPRGVEGVTLSMEVREDRRRITAADSEGAELALLIVDADGSDSMKDTAYDLYEALTEAVR